MNTYYIYIMATKKHGVIYIGVTNDLKKRVFQHKKELIEGFTKRYHIHDLVYFEQTNDINCAIKREKQLKRWKREWKINLIEKINPEWKDLSESFLPDLE